jgi:hypothetical protein
MPDVAMAALGLSAVYLIVRAVEDDRPGFAALAGGCAAGAFLCRFSAALVLPLLVAYPVFRRRLDACLWLPVVVAVGAVGLYETWTVAQMGEPHFVHTLESWSNPLDLDRAVRFPFLLAAYLGAQLPPTGIVLYAMGARDPRGRARVWWALTLAVVVALALEGGNPRLVLMALLFTWPAVAILIDAAGRMLRAIRSGFVARSPVEALTWTCALALWTLTFATVSHAHVAAKYSLLPLAFAILYVLDALKELTRGRRTVGRVWLPASVAITCALGFAVGLSDARWSNTYRDFFQSGAFRQYWPTSGRLFFNADWGFRYYAEKAGLTMYTGVPLEPGERLLRAEQVASLLPLDGEPKRLIAVIPLRYPGPFAVMNGPASAGFYSHSWGKYPFTPQREVVDRVFVLEQEPSGTARLER